MPQIRLSSTMQMAYGTSPADRQKLIFDFLALDGLAARILWHRFLERNRVSETGSQIRVRKFCSKWENSRLHS